MKGRIILASASPRRIEILRRHGAEAIVMPADVDEFLPEGTEPRTGCMYNALKKALYVESLLKGDPVEDAVEADTFIIGADTIVFDGRIFGKPGNDAEAFSILQSLRNRTHQVMTGTAVIRAGKDDRRVFCECTSVSFGEYSDQEILDYIATGEPADKAGAYAIQGGWSAHVTEISGDYYNVIGLPWERLRKELLSMGADVQFSEEQHIGESR